VPTKSDKTLSNNDYASSAVKNVQNVISKS